MGLMDKMIEFMMPKMMHMMKKRMHNMKPEEVEKIRANNRNCMG